MDRPDMTPLPGACIVCRASAYRMKPMEGGWHIHKCAHCRLEFCHPMPTREAFDAFYASYADPRAAETVVRANAERNIRSLERFGLRRDSRLLDYGSGQGLFCRTGGSDRWRCYDPYTKDSDPSALAPERYDWITLWGVLEHIDDPLKVLAELRGCLIPGGHLALTTVSTELAIPYRHKPPEHVTYWTRPAMEHALRAAGLEILEYRPYVMVQAGDVYLNAVLRTVPEELRARIHHDLPEMVEVPTNEVFVVARRPG